MEVALAMDNSESSKRRKVVGNGELKLSSSIPVRITGCDGGDEINASKELSDLSGDMSFCSADVPVSCCSNCSSNGLIMEKLKCADLQERAGTETTTVRDNLNRRESTPTSEFMEESGELSREKKPVTNMNMNTSRRTVPPEKTPPAAELEEFFAAAEKDLHNCFKEKYNFDIVKEVPLKGRFEWVQLKP